MFALFALSQTPTFAQSFDQAVFEYVSQNGTNTYKETPLQPEWFRNNEIEVNDPITGKLIVTHRRNEFWIGGVCVWAGRWRTYDPNGNLIP